MATFNLEIVTPAGALFSEPIMSLRAPGIEGSLGVLAGHAPLMTALTVGPIKVTLANKDEEYIATSGGFLHVQNNHVTILADTAERASDIDVSRAEAAIARARESLASGEAIDYTETMEALARATNRLQVAKMREGS